MYREKEVMVKKIVNKYDAQVKISEDAVDKYKEKVEIQMDQMFGEMRTEVVNSYLEIKSNDLLFMKSLLLVTVFLD
jgi:phage gp36-like protein